MKQDKYGAGQGNLATYIAGFGLSLILTITGYLMVLRHVHSQHVIFSDQFLMFALASLAVVQLIVQLVFFLHLSHESDQRWNLLVAQFAVGTVIIIVFGSIWIMGNLNYHHDHALTTQQTTNSIINEENVHHH
jgi:cytochrome o ubiquinol oxidase operon protein cyoD